MISNEKTANRYTFNHVSHKETYVKRRYDNVLFILSNKKSLVRCNLVW